MVRYSYNGKVEEPEAVDAEVVKPMVDYVERIIKEKEKTQQKITNALQKRVQNQLAEAKWRNPASAPIQVRREGWLRRPNARDLARVEAAKASNDLAVLLANALTNHA